MSQLDGKIALVTGASRGIGKAIATQLAQQGATVIGTATSKNGAQAISDYLSEFGGQGFALNVTDKDSVDATLKAINEAHGGIDILVNNAGITRDNLLMRMKDDEWQDIIDTNLTSIFTLSKAVLRGMMKKRFGRIINISSIVGVTGNPGQSNYSASKAGIVAMAKSLAQEVASRGITVNNIAPGFISTAMTDALTEKQRESILASIPAGRFGVVEDIASCVLFLASDEASYITGQTLHINGGMAMI